MTMSDLVLPFGLLGSYCVFIWFLWRETLGLPWIAREFVRARLPVSSHLHERVLFVCTHNSARSQRAEALLRNASPSQFLVSSAGTTPTHVHPRPWKS